MLNDTRAERMFGNHLSDDNNRFLGPGAAAKRNPNKKRQPEHGDTHPQADVEVVAEKKTRVMNLTT
jgi:hypothetical protein